jgi:hypothetical protein
MIRVRELDLLDHQRLAERLQDRGAHPHLALSSCSR